MNAAQRARSLSPVSRLALVAGAIFVVETALFAFPLHQLGAPVRGGDGPEYLRLASNLLHHGVFSDSQHAPFDPYVLRSPGYPVLLAALKACGLGSLGAIRVFQLLLLAITAWATGVIALRVAGRLAGTVATVVTATYLPFLWSTTEQMTETAATLGVALLALILLAARERAGSSATRLSALAGLVLAATAYTRPSLLALAVPVSVLIAWDMRRIAPAAAFAAMVVVAVAPWAVRTSLDAHTLLALQAGSGAGRYASNQQNLGHLPIPLDGNGWVAFKRVSRRASSDLRRGRYTPQEQVEFDRRLARAAPSVPLHDVLSRLPARMRGLWGPTAGTPHGQPWTTSAQRTAWLQYWMLAALVSAGLVLRRRSLRADWPLWLPALYITAIHTVIHIESRYSLPARPGLIVIGAAAAATLYTKAAFREPRLAAAEGL